MHDVSDQELLRDYALKGSEEAFAALVQRHINLVYSVAFRHVRIAACAEEITQVVFVILARKAASLPPSAVLEGWLYETTRLTSLNFLRGERRRQLREQEAYMQSTLQASADEPVWNQLAPALDEAMARLGKKDRDAIILRFFKEKNLGEVAAAMQLTEAAAQSRVHRAVEKLRNLFIKRGVVLTAAAITGAISVHSVQAAPVGLGKSVTAMAIAKGATASGSTLTLIKGALKLMAWTKVKTIVVVALGVLLAAGAATETVRLINPPEPSYEGKLLSVWAQDFWQRTPDGGVKITREPATDAIQHIGRRAVPTLLKMVSATNALNGVPPEDLHMQAVGGFYALGSNAETAIPELSRLLNQPRFVRGAAESLASIGAASATPLIQALGNTNPAIRYTVAMALGHGAGQRSGPSAPGVNSLDRPPPLAAAIPQIIPALIDCARDPDKSVRTLAAAALGGIHQQPGAVVPVLMELLGDSEATCRWNAAQSLGRFGPDANAAIPLLLNATTDTNRMVQRMARTALQKIDPQSASGTK